MTRLEELALTTLTTAYYFCLVDRSCAWLADATALDLAERGTLTWDAQR